MAKSDAQIATPKQQYLDLGVEVERDVGGIEMGVLENGIAYLTQRGLAHILGGIRLAGDSSTNTGRNSRNGLGTLEVPNGNGAVNCIGSIGASPLRVTIPAWVGRS